MRHLIISTVVFSVAIGAARMTKAQVSRPATCPTIRVSCNDVFQRSPITCTASIDGADPLPNPTFRWTVSDEMTIISGQGTSALTVEWQKPNFFLAAVKVGGLPPECESSEEYRAIIDPGPRKVVEFGAVSFKVEKSNLDRLADELRKDSTAQGYVMSYAGRHSWEGEASWRGERARHYLIRSGGFDPRRIVVIDSGHRETHAIELYVVPSGVTPPAASPTVDPGEATIIGKGHKRSVRP
jgi:hypothetical protein